MRDNITTYRIWAPAHFLWTDWAKPVLFTYEPSFDIDLVLPRVNWISSANQNTMVIVDLPGKSGVEEGLALSGMGYRPVPLYNGVYGHPGNSMVVNVDEIVRALYKGADTLVALDLRYDAPPVFLLDSNRMKGAGKLPGTYDNRWCVFPQDMPSALYLQKNGITQVILRSDSVQDDLSHILRRYQEQGIKIYLCDKNGQTRPVNISKPSLYKNLLYRFSVTLGLTRNGTGGFGGQIPDVVRGGSGRGYVRIG